MSTSEVAKKPVRYVALAFAGFLLFVAGVVMLGATLYQVEVSPPPEIPHMEIPSGKYEWRSLNMVVTVAGVMFMVLGLVLMAVSYMTASRDEVE